MECSRQEVSSKEGKCSDYYATARQGARENMRERERDSESAKEEEEECVRAPQREGGIEGGRERESERERVYVCERVRETKQVSTKYTC